MIHETVKFRAERGIMQNGNGSRFTNIPLQPLQAIQVPLATTLLEEQFRFAVSRIQACARQAGKVDAEAIAD